MMRSIVLCLTLVAAGSAVALDQEQAEQAAEIRESVFELVRWNIGPVVGMVKEEIPFDAEQARRNASRIAYLVTLIPDAFATDTRGFDLETEARDDIWAEHEDFLGFAENVAAKSKALEAAAATGDFAKVSAAFLEMGQACKDCHERFRED